MNLKLIGIYAKDVIQEMARVKWPSKDETLGSTFAVISMVVAMMVFVFCIDSFCVQLIKFLLGVA